jgi:hypothetical protein
MLSIGIKNAILFLLIILILHFLLKNILLDKKPDKSNLPSRSIHSLNESSEPSQPRQPIEYNNYFETFKNGDCSSNDENKKMLDYLNEESIIKDCNKQQACPFPSRDDDSRLEVSGACDMDLKPQPAETLKVKADCHLLQDKKNFTVIKEYENEKGINGGKLYDDIGAFDSYDSYFQTYSSQCGAPIS